MILSSLVPAQTEWIIKKMARPSGEPISESELSRTLVYHVGNFYPEELQFGAEQSEKGGARPHATGSGDCAQVICGFFRIQKFRLGKMIDL